MNQVENKGRAIALLPIGVFLVIFLGSGIVTGDFYAMPAIVAFLIALAVAFMQNKQLSFAEKLSVISKGVGDENIITMSLIFLCAGGFSGAVTAAGGVESTVNFGLSVLPSNVAVAGFLSSAALFQFLWEHLWGRLRHSRRLLWESVKRRDMRWRFALEQLCVAQCLVTTYL